MSTSSPANPTFVRQTLADLIEDRPQAKNNMKKGRALAQKLILRLGFILIAFGLVAYAISPRTIVSHLLQTFSESGPGWLVWFGLLYGLSAASLCWLAGLSTVFAHADSAKVSEDLDEPDLKIWLLCMGLALIPTLAALFFLPLGYRHGWTPLVASCLLLPLQSLFSLFVLLRIATQMQEHAKQLTFKVFLSNLQHELLGPLGKLWCLCLIFNLLVLCQILLPCLFLLTFFTYAKYSTIEMPPSLLTILTDILLGLFLSPRGLLLLGVILAVKNNWGLSGFLAYATVQLSHKLQGLSETELPNVQEPAPQDSEATKSRKFGQKTLKNMGILGCCLALVGCAYLYQLWKWWTLEQDWKKYEKQAQIWAQHQRPVLRGKALAGNGADVYWSLINPQEPCYGCRSEKKPFFKVESDDENLFNHYLSGLYDEYDEILNVPDLEPKYRPQIQALQEAMQHETITYPITFTSREQNPNFIEAKNLAELMALSAAVKIKAGHCHEGMVLFLDTLRFGQDIGLQWTRVAHSAGIEMQLQTIRSVGPHLQTSCLSPADYKQFLKEFQTLQQTPWRFVSPLLGQAYLHMHNALDFIGKDPFLALPEYTDMYLLAREQLMQLSQYQLMSWYQIFQKIQEPEQDKNSMSNVLLLQWMPGYIYTANEMAGAEAYLNGFYQFLALYAYFREKGEYPDSLDQLVPAYLPKLPLDPFTDRPFVYRRLSKQDFRLYSLNQGGTDDGGKGVYFRQDCYGVNDKKRDIVFAPGRPKKACEY